jgi:phosphate transport system permease protein
MLVQSRISPGRWLMTVAGATPVLLTVLMLVILAVGAAPALRVAGWHLVTDTTWDLGNLYGATTRVHGVTVPVGAHYGALPFFLGTLWSSVIAMVIAVPIATRTAVLTAYGLRGRLKTAVAVLVDLIAGLPSVVIGLWGLTVLVPWIAHTGAPLLTPLGRYVPWLRGPVTSGMGLLAAGLVLALMITPVITSAMREMLDQVPQDVREAGFACGLTSWEVVRQVCLPAIKSGRMGALALGWGRAIGETMAVLMVGGSAANVLPTTLFSPISTVAAAIADQLDAALTDPTGMALHALSALALVLMLITIATGVIARLLVRRTAHRAGWTHNRTAAEEDAAWNTRESA